MKLNCRAGDIAVLIKDILANKCDGSIVLAKDGTVVECAAIETVVNSPEYPGWFIKEPFIGKAVCKHGRHYEFLIVSIADRLLRPLRDPGDNAKDELLRPLPTGVKA